MWDMPLLRAGERFVEALPVSEQSEEVSRVVRFCQECASSDKQDQLLDQLPNASRDQEAAFIAVELRALCYRRKEAAESIWKRLVDQNWRQKCLDGLPLDAWEIIAEGLLHVQRREGGRWEAKMPFLWAKGAERNASDKQRSKFFLQTLLISSLSGGTVAGIKSLLRSPKLPELKEPLLGLREELRLVYDSCDAAVAPRIREVLAVLSSL